MGNTKDKAAQLRTMRPPFYPELITLQMILPPSAKEAKREIREAAYREQVGADAYEIDFLTNAKNKQCHAQKK